MIFLGLDSSGFKPTHASSHYYAERAKLRRRWIKLSIGGGGGGGDMLQQQVIMCTIKIRRAPPARHDNVVDFKPTIVSKTSKKIKPLSVVVAVVADKGYDSDEENHALVRDKLHAYYSSVIPPRYQDVPIWKKTHGKYRKEMKRGYLKPLYNQRNKEDETIFSALSLNDCLESMLRHGESGRKTES